MSKAVFVGGYNGSSSYSADVYMTEDNITFTKMADFPLVVNGASVCLFNNEWYVMGGEISGGTKQTTVYKSTDLSSWTLVTNAPGWSARNYANTFVYQNKLWLIGGKLSASETVGVWNTSDGIAWTKVGTVTGISSSNRYTCPVVAHDTLGIFLFGGINGSSVKNNNIYNSLDGITWTKTVASWDARSDHGVVYFNNQFLLIGGLDSANSTFPSSAYYYTSTDGLTWTVKTGSNLYAAFPYFASSLYAVMDSKLIVFGGSSNTQTKPVSTTDGTTWVSGTATLPTPIYKRYAANLAVKIEAVSLPTISLSANGSSISSGTIAITLSSAPQTVSLSANGTLASNGTATIKLGIKFLANGNSISSGQATLLIGIVDNTMYVLRGRVVNKTTGVPIAGAKVIAINQDNNLVYTATTDLNGYYELACRVNGTYDLFSRFKDTYNNHFTSLLKSYIAVGG